MACKCALPSNVMSVQRVDIETVSFKLDTRPTKWDKRFLALAEHIAQWSKDPSTKVGAVIVDKDKRVVGMGYNGFPRGVEDTEKRYNDRPVKYAMVVHAELNAILNAKSSVEGCTIYVWPQFVTDAPPTCEECAKAIIQSGIKRVVGSNPGIRDGSAWTDGIKLAQQMYKEAGVIVDHV